MIDVTPTSKYSVKGAKRGQEQQRKPNISKDTVASISTIKILYGLGEGEYEGLVNGGNSIYLEGTPLLDSQGNPNFEGVTWDFRHGTNDQEYIQGFPDVSNEQNIGIELTNSQPFVKAFNDTQISALRVRLKFGRLSQTDTENGDVTGVKVDYAMDIQTDGGSYNQVLVATVEDKASAGYERSHRIDLPKASIGWQIRIRRLTPDSDSDFLQNAMSVDAIAEVIDVKLRYPNTALLGLQYDAELFSNVAKMAALVRGKIIRVPSNYNPETRAYIGIWDGTFKDAYSNNPAWVYYDLCLEWRYGLGERLDITMIDKWSLYQLGQYCDERVSNGMNGTEPRFTCNVYIQQQADAYQVLSNISGIFRAMSYWNGEQIIIDADVPQDPVYTFSVANVIEGNFEYTGTRHRDRHTLIKVAWDNPDNEFQTEYEYIRDEEAIAKFGVKTLELSAFGCTSQAQAQRAGLWALKTEQLETRQVAFGAGLDGFIPQVGNIVNVNDDLLTSHALAGRVSTVSETQRIITLDRDVTAIAGDVLIVNNSNGKTERRNISHVTGNRITVTAAFANAEPEHVWAIESNNVPLMRFRVMSINQNDDATFNIVGIQHDASKYADIDNNTYVDADKYPDNNVVSDNSIDAPSNVSVSARYRTDQGVTVTTLVIEWSQVNKATQYDIEYRKDSGSWVKLPRVSGVSTELDDIYRGTYTARVRAVSAFGIQSSATESAPTYIESKVGITSTLSSFNVIGILFGMYIYWGFGDGSDDTAYTEIEQAPDPDVSVTQLGTYAYPTNSVTIQNLPPNITIFYRARLVDKFGTAGDWTDWKSGTTSSDAQAVLDLLNGKISNSQLDQDLQASIGSISDLSAAILDEDIVRVSDLEPLSQRTTTAQTTAQDAKDASVTNRASIQQQLQSINGLYAQYTIKVDVNGRISGFGLASSPYSSTFAIRADEFYIAPPNANSGSAEAAFIYRTTPYTDPNTGTVIPAGLYLKDAFIANASVGTLKIQGQAVSITTSARQDNSSSTPTVYLNPNGGTVKVSIFMFSFKKGGGSAAITLYVNGVSQGSYTTSGSNGYDTLTNTFEWIVAGGYGNTSMYATLTGQFEEIKSMGITAVCLKR